MESRSPGASALHLHSGIIHDSQDMETPCMSSRDAWVKVFTDAHTPRMSLSHGKEGNPACDDMDGQSGRKGQLLDNSADVRNLKKPKRGQSTPHGDRDWDALFEAQTCNQQKRKSWPLTPSMAVTVNDTMLQTSESARD